MSESTSKSSAVVVDVIPPSCPKCGSTTRSEKYNKSQTRSISGTLPGGRQYTHVIHRRTRCECGQIRVERVFENRTAKNKSAGRTKSVKKSAPKPEAPSETASPPLENTDDEPVAVPSVEG